MAIRKRTRKLTQSITAKVKRRDAAVRAAAARVRCSGCGSFLNVQGECRHPECEGSNAK